MRLGLLSVVLLVTAAVVMFISVWLGLAAFVASVVVQLMARKRFGREVFPRR
jgi:hypothetical protein